MSDSIFLIAGDGTLREAFNAPYETEDRVHKLLAANLDLLPGRQINQDSPRRWLLVKSEAGVPNREGGGVWWSLDLLVVDQDGIPTLVEVKRASDTRTRREVVAQVLDYAANGSAFWTPEQLRSWFEEANPAGSVDRLLEFLEDSDGDPEEVAQAFWQKVGANLREGQIRLIFAADEIPASLKRLVEFLNEQMPRVEVLAVEIRQYLADDGEAGALVPRLVGQTARAQAVKERAATATRPVPWTSEEVLEQIAPAGMGAVAIAQAVLNWADAHPHLRVKGGKGPKDRSVTMHADSEQGPIGVLSLYVTESGSPTLEIRLLTMFSTPPYDQSETRSALAKKLGDLEIPRLTREGGITAIRPGIPLGDLAGGRLEELLTVVNQWIDGVHAHERDSRKDGSTC